MLSARDPLPARPRRVAVAGVSGVGKTTLARRIAAVAGIPHTEIDALFHGPDWTTRTEFLDAREPRLSGRTSLPPCCHRLSVNG